MIDIEKLKQEIVERLKPLNPEKIILFGSYAYGTPNEDSDVDLYIVTSDDFLPQSWREKADIYLKFSNKLRDLQKSVPIDLIVHTKKMYEKFIEMDSMFSRKVLQSGKKSYEKFFKRVA
jgi:predicted nucleotidyltransferase